MNHYELLDVARDASADDVRAAYVRLAKRVHPDSGGSAALFRQIEEAYRVLNDPSERRRYDRDLASGAAGGSGGADDRRTSAGWPGGGWPGAGHGMPGYGMPGFGGTPPTPQDIAEAVIKGGTKLVKGVVDKHAQRKHDEEAALQAAWPKTLGLDFQRVDMKAWRPILDATEPGSTRCSASWARKEHIEPAMDLHALRVDPGSPPHLIVWQVGTSAEWVSWRTANADESFVDLRVHVDASPGCRPRWARRSLPTGTHLVVHEWFV